MTPGQNWNFQNLNANLQDTPNHIPSDDLSIVENVVDLSIVEKEFGEEGCCEKNVTFYQLIDPKDYQRIFKTLLQNNMTPQI